ncbi:MAG TPA: hypothetical protein VK659_08460 [Asanoa sp.]|nr:hypothetical protein [Asanoa sp.]
MGLSWLRPRRRTPAPRQFELVLDVAPGMADAGLVRFTLVDAARAELGSRSVPAWYLTELVKPDRAVKVDIVEGEWL